MISKIMKTGCAKSMEMMQKRRFGIMNKTSHNSGFEKAMLYIVGKCDSLAVHTRILKG